MRELRHRVVVVDDDIHDREFSEVALNRVLPACRVYSSLRYSSEKGTQICGLLRAVLAAFLES